VKAHLGVKHLSPLKKSLVPSLLHLLQIGDVILAINLNYEFGIMRRSNNKIDIFEISFLENPIK